MKIKLYHIHYIILLWIRNGKMYSSCNRFIEQIERRINMQLSFSLSHTRTLTDIQGQGYIPFVFSQACAVLSLCLFLDPPECDSIFAVVKYSNKIRIENVSDRARNR